MPWLQNLGVSHSFTSLLQSSPNHPEKLNFFRIVLIIPYYENSFKVNFPLHELIYENYFSDIKYPKNPFVCVCNLNVLNF